jgi:TRAP-type C4-dicarboxylate transport system substrate-binding protein
VRYLLTLLFLVLLIGSGFTQRIKFATVAPEGSTYLKILREYTSEVEKLTGGKVTFKIYPSQSQGDEKDVLRKIRLGQLHSAGFTGVGLGEIMSEVRVLELPMLFRNSDEVDYISSKFYDKFDQKFEENNFIILGWADVGFAYVFSQKAIASIQDLKGTKMWMWEGDPLAEATFKALGVSAIPLSLVDVLTSLQTNLIQAVYVPPLPCVTLQWYTRVNTMTDVPLANVSGAVLISKKMFDKLEPEHQKILREKGREYMSRLVQESREDNDKAIELMKQNGIEIVKVSEEHLREFETAARKAYQDLVGRLYSQELLGQITGALEEYRAQKAQK